MTSCHKSVWTRNSLPEATLLNNNSSWWSLHWSLSHCILLLLLFSMFYFPSAMPFLSDDLFSWLFGFDVRWDFKVQTKCWVMVNVWNRAFTYVNDLVYIRKWASRERACDVTITYQTPNPRSCTPVLSTLKACTHPFVDSRGFLLWWFTHLFTR